MLKLLLPTIDPVHHENTGESVFVCFPGFPDSLNNIIIIIITAYKYKITKINNNFFIINELVEKGKRRNK